MSGISQEYLNDVMNDVAAALQLKEWKYDKQSFVNIAQNYFGIIIPVNLIGKKWDKSVNFSIALKLAPTDVRFRVSGAVTIMFGKEIFVYSKILTKYREILNELQQVDYVMPNCYYVCSDYCKEVIAMENMCEKGYKPHITSVFLDLDHISIALKSLAQFHSLSFILKERDKNIYEEAGDFCIPLSDKTNKRFVTILLDRLGKALIAFQNTSYVHTFQILESKCSEFIESAANSVKKLCLSHGDIWKENLLFKYKDNSPISACIIDYQTTRMCSPAFDVLYLIITSTAHTLRNEYLQQMFDTYYQMLEQNLAFVNLDSNIIYSRDMFKYDLQMVAPACLIIANTAIWLSSGLQQDGHVRSKIELNSEQEKLEAVKKYTCGLSGIIEDLSHHNLLKY